MNDTLTPEKVSAILARAEWEWKMGYIWRSTYCDIQSLCSSYSAQAARIKELETTDAAREKVIISQAEKIDELACKSAAHVDLVFVARNIVNQLFDKAEVAVAKRQVINDKMRSVRCRDN